MYRGAIQVVLPMPSPTKHPKTSVYYFIVRVPADLIEKVGRGRCNESLGTKDPAEAKMLFAQRHAKAQREWALLRTGPTPLTHKQVMALAGQYYEDICRLHGDDPGDPEEWSASLDGSEELGQTAVGREKLHGGEADRILLDAELLVEAESREMLLLQMHLAFNKAVFNLMKNGVGNYSPDSAAASFPPPTAIRRKPQVTLSDLFALWEGDHQANGGSPRTVGDFRGKLDSLIKFVGHEDAERITPRQISDWCDDLKLTCSPRTVSEKYLAAVKAVYRVGVDKFRVDEDPTAKVTVNFKKTPKLRDPGFSDEEAKTILNSANRALFSDDGASDTAKLARRWIPWICAHTGARGGEIAHLRKVDFMDVGGMACLEITPEAGTVKTKEFRRVPLHPQLIEMGLMEFVKDAPDGPLFFRSSGRGDSNQAAGVRGKIGDWVRDVAGIVDRQVQPNHAWRHRFKTLARELEIQTDTSDCITGHVSKMSANGYGVFTMKTMLTAITKMPWYEVD